MQAQTPDTKEVARRQTSLLKEARYALGKDYIDSLLTAPLRFGQFCPHDTGCQISIIAKVDEMASQEVWYGSIWYATCYEFNDNRYVLGIQPGYEKVAPIIDEMFERVAWDLSQHHAQKALAAAAHEVKVERTEAEARAAYLSMILGGR